MTILKFILQLTEDGAILLAIIMFFRFFYNNGSNLKSSYA